MTKLFALIVLLLSLTVNAAPISPVENYEYTNLSSMREAMQVWRSMKTNTEWRSQCFNRALTWAYDMDKEFGIKSRKIIIHYSQKFNKELSSKWGFHIAPLLSVQGEDYAFDPKFMKTPVKKHAWINNFVGDGKRVLLKKRNKIVKDLRKFRKRLRKVRRGDFVFGLYVTPEGLRQKIRELEGELRYLEVSETGPVDIKCKKITHIEELDYNLNGAWCYYQEVNMYYWGIPQLRLLNYGQTSVPSKSDLPYARIRGSKYTQNSWNMEQVWEAREEAFSYIDELWPQEYAEREYQKELERSHDGWVM